jgi:hypothetical protein
MIYDCFTFHNELDLLEMRLRILDAVVDYFVLCEAPFTFRGSPKPLSFAQAPERFAAWRDRIIPLVYPGPVDPNPWRNEFGQRDYLATALERCAPDDLILIGDCDEIPDPRNVARRPSPGKILGHLQRLSIGYFNRVLAEPYAGTRALAAGDIAGYGTLNAVRGRALSDLETIVGGWHFTSLGGAAVAEQKMRAYSHLEYDVPYYRDRFRLAAGFASDHDARWIPFDASFPALLHADERWSSFVWDRPAPEIAAVTPALEHAHGCFAYVPPDAANVFALTHEGAAWERAGKQRFGARFGGVGPHVAACTTAGPESWVVVDGIERYDTTALAALRATGAGVVAYAGNARSRDAFEAVVNGAPFPPGPALGQAEWRARILAAGWEIAVTDRIAIPGIFAIFADMPERLSVENGRFRFIDVPRETLAEFLAKAFVFTMRPVPAGRAGG